MTKKARLRAEEDSMATYDKFKAQHPWRLRWEGLKLAVSEWWHGYRPWR